MTNTPLQPRQKLAIKHNTRTGRALVKDIQYRLDVNTLHRGQDTKALGLNEIGRVHLRTTVPLLCDPYSKNRTTGSFILIDEAMGITVGAGMIKRRLTVHASMRWGVSAARWPIRLGYRAEVQVRLSLLGRRVPKLSRIRNIARNAARPGYLPVMTHKVYERVRYGVRRERAAAIAWAESRTVDLEAWACGIDAQLWAEAVDFAVMARARGEDHMEDMRAKGVAMGGGGCIDLLYFLTRLRTPENIIETGVAHGWSSWAFLAALNANGTGHLWSSDFPYFRNENPERWIASLVPDDLKGPWDLYIKGDRKNLDEILSPAMVVQLVHYDSDKSPAGRQFFVDRIAPHLSPDAVFVMDDVGDNLWFRDYAAGRDVTLLEYAGKHLAVLGI